MAASEGWLDDLAGAILDGAPIDWASAESSADLAERPLISQLRVFDRIGGAFGEVYRAWDTRLDREVALKLLPASSSSGDYRGTSIIEEGRLLARVLHPNVVTIYGAERIGNRIGLWMELVKGRTLQQVLDEGKAFSGSEAVDIAIELCRATAAVHRAGLLHRDIKPHNVMTAEDGRVVLMDFGTGRELSESSSAVLAGTPLYLAPELLSGSDPTVQSDIYSLGVLLFHLLTRSYPVRAESLRDLRLAHERRDTVDIRQVRPAVSPKLARIIARAIDPRPERRHETIDSLAADLLALKPRSTLATWARTLSVAAALLLTAAGVWEVRARQMQWKTTPMTLLAALGGVNPAGGPGPGARARIRSMAVLPFKPLVATESDERLQLGMTEAVINQLSRITTLRVEPLARVRRYSAMDQDPLEAATGLGVEAVLDGHVQLTDSGVQVRSRLLRTSDGTALTTNQWSEPFGNILDVQARLAGSIADALQVTLTPAERASFGRQETTSPEAFRHYMFGRAHLEVRNRRRMLQAEREFREASRLDPRYARAYAGLSLALIQMAWLGERSGIEVMDPAKEAALNALAIDDSVALAHSALAQVYESFEFDPVRAQAEHLRAMELDEREEWVLRGYGAFLTHRGAFDEALELNRRVLELDPTSAYSNRLRAVIFYAARRYDACVAECRRTLTLDPDDLALSYQWLAKCLEQQGQQREAVDAREKNRAARGNLNLADRMLKLYAARGWEAYWRESLTLAGTQDVAVASAHVRLGNLDEAVRSFERLYQIRSPWLSATNHPEWDALRSHPGFQAIRQRTGLTDSANTALAASRSGHRH